MTTTPSLRCLARLLSSRSLPAGPVLEVARRYPFQATSHFLGLLREPGDPLWRQVVPDPRELENNEGWDDPLAEEALSPVPHLVHRYPDRVLWLVAEECAIHCRFCTRKRRWRQSDGMTAEQLDAALDYVRGHREIRDVLLSGGDPLMLPVERLTSILSRLRAIGHVEIIRIGTRVPVAAPQRVTGVLAQSLGKYHPLYMNIHFNHPLEITAETVRACNRLADAGIPLGSQTVLLKDVNDHPEVLGDLFKRLLRIRVRPYYLLQMDLTRSTAHFRTPISTGLQIIRALRNRISGLALPQLVLDLPGGHGKIPLVPRYVDRLETDRLELTNFRDERCAYPLLPGESEDLQEWLHGSQRRS
ncbi:MAG TPA: lysine 2,3-aminomutase [Syntrophobacteraceae bacterium]|nr:lysine 2,3-aminomutase [Syntrophobacteraceae bacterium]